MNSSNISFDVDGLKNRSLYTFLVIVGEDDKVTPKDESIKIHELLPNSRLAIIERAGHLILYEKADDLNKLIEEFVEEL